MPDSMLLVYACPPPPEPDKRLEVILYEALRAGTPDMGRRGEGERPVGAERLETIVRGDAWVMRVLEIVRDAGLPDAWVGAGMIRDLVWGELYGDGFRPGELNDVDVAFFDPRDLSRG